MKTPKHFLQVPQTYPNSCWLWGLAPLMSQCRSDPSALGWVAEATGTQFELGPRQGQSCSVSVYNARLSVCFILVGHKSHI